MIIYTDSLQSPDGKRMTPAHVYSMTRDFSVILDEIANDNLPVNTQKPFPVNWEIDNTINWDHQVNNN